MGSVGSQWGLGAELQGVYRSPWWGLGVSVGSRGRAPGGPATDEECIPPWTTGEQGALTISEVVNHW